ncbi:MAG TPA: hypothetical protein VKD90_04700 [Gemmataceae bacterium]|nr:hypothetical protein [Gemmataceae bacterium]
MIAARDLLTPCQGKLACRLRAKSPPVGRSASPSAGELELENVSATDLDIPADIHPLQNLNLRVTDAHGAVVSEGWYGNQFSPGETAADLRLQPGQTFVIAVALLGTVPPDRRGSGTYIVQAIFDCPELRAVSDPLTVTI